MTVLAAAAVDEIAAIVFIDIAVIIVVARLMGALFRRLRQPAVVGEILAGIALGPSLLGLLPGDLPGVLFPEVARDYLGVIAQLGLVIFMFIVGLELDMNLIRGKERVAAVISFSSVLLPFASGFALAAFLHPRHPGADGQAVDFLPFALFLGAAMSITAFPVLARILTERGMYRTAVGALALACAAVDDILAWSLLAVVVAVAQAESLTALPVTLGRSLLYVTVMFAVVRPLLTRLVTRYQQAGRLTPEILAVVLVGILVSSWVTDRIGIHAIFGAFAFGAAMPRRDSSQLFAELLQRLEHVTVLLLLPVFFIATGLRVDIGGLDAGALPELGLILLVAVAGKFVGAAAAGRLQGLRPRHAASIGVLMNTRGLTELVILNVGLSIGVLDGSLFTMMVIMAVVTTVMTEPLLRLVYPPEQLRRDIAEAERAALGAVQAYRVLVAVDEPTDAERLVDVAAAIVGDERPSEVVLTRFLPHPGGAEISGGLVAELAAMAVATEVLNAQARRLAERDIDCSVLSRFSADVAADLLAQAEAVEADVLLLERTPDGDRPQARLDERLPESPPCDVAVLDDPLRRRLAGSDAAVLVRYGQRPSADAAAEIGARMARALGAELLLADHGAGSRRRGRRAGALAERATRLGIAARAVSGPEEAAGVALVVAGAADETAHEAGQATLTVTAPRGTVRDGLEALERARERGAVPTGEAG